jgi:hypothetical protein
MLSFTTLKRKDIYSANTSAVREMFFFTPALVTDVYKQHTAACPLFPAAEVRLDFSRILPYISSTIPQHLWLQN